MSRLHLHPLPSADVVAFPHGARQNPDAVIAQLRNIQTHLQVTNGAYLGRAFFAEASIWVVAQTAAEADDVTACRDALLDDFETALRCVGGPVGFFSGPTKGAA